MNKPYHGKVVVINGLRERLTRAIVAFYASQGASVLVNGHDDKQVNDIVSTVNSADRRVVGTTFSGSETGKAITKACDVLGGVHIVINIVAVTPSEGDFEASKWKDWDETVARVITGNYKIVHAAWQRFRPQKAGCVVTILPAETLDESYAHATNAAALYSQIGFTQTLAKEGLRNKITATALLIPELDTVVDDAVSKVNSLTMQPSTTKTGEILRLVGRSTSKSRLQRSQGALLKADDSLTPDAVVGQWRAITDFHASSQYPDGPNKFMDLLKEGSMLPRNHASTTISLKGRVVLITGAGAGLGQAYALAFADAGASVVVNDIKNPQRVVDEIRTRGGKAVGVTASAEEGEKNVGAAIAAFGRIDIVVNNAGIIRDKAFHNMTDELWNPVLAVHLAGTFQNIKAAWPHFLKQGYGRVVNTTSVSGIYGNFGQANYATAKAAIIGLTRGLAAQGARSNIYVNAVAPNAGTEMTKSILPDDVIQALKPAHIAPLIVALCSDAVPHAPTGQIYEAGSGWFGNTRWQFQEPTEDGSILSAISRAKTATAKAHVFEYTEKDLILYALSVGAKRTDLGLVFEGARDFQALPVFGLIPFFNAKQPYSMEEIVKSFDPRKLLHVDQYLEIKRPIPTSGLLKTYPSLLQVVDKGSAAIVVQKFVTTDENGAEVFYNETTVFIRGSGGFRGDKKLIERGAATAANEPPRRAPDATVDEATTEDQAALYRLNGDLNPLHIDPQFSAKGGFPVPILHGLCSLGIAGKIIYQRFGAYKNLKARFTGVVIPGQTLRVEMWKDVNKVLFQVKVVETGKMAISSAAVELTRTSPSL